jgi:hypothetical protein
MNTPATKLTTRFLTIAALLLLGAATAHSGWLDQGQKVLTGMAGNSSPPSTLTDPEVSDALKEALRIGSYRVVEQLGTLNGFEADPMVHIPLPDSMKMVSSGLEAVGMSVLVDDLELKLNRAAEVATPKAKELFWKAIQEMSMDDVMAIYNGPDDAATRYFQEKMSADLALEMRPVVDSSLAEVGAIQSYDTIMKEYKKLPLVPDVHADLTDYVVARGMDGIFYYLGQEEAAIRTDPARQTTELLQKVFGAQ